MSSFVRSQWKLHRSRSSTGTRSHRRKMRQQLRSITWWIWLTRLGMSISRSKWVRLSASRTALSSWLIALRVSALRRRRSFARHGRLKLRLFWCSTKSTDWSSISGMMQKSATIGCFRSLKTSIAMYLSSFKLTICSVRSSSKNAIEGSHLTTLVAAKRWVMLSWWRQSKSSSIRLKKEMSRLHLLTIIGASHSIRSAPRSLNSSAWMRRPSKSSCGANTTTSPVRRRS